MQLSTVNVPEKTFQKKIHFSKAMTRRTCSRWVLAVGSCLLTLDLLSEIPCHVLVPF